MGTKPRRTLVRSNVRFGSQADMCSALGDVRFVPKADILAFTRSPHREPCPLYPRKRTLIGARASCLEP
jgi:hypothetical protein